MAAFKFIQTMVLVLAMANCWAAEEKPTPTGAFRGQTQYYQITCRMAERIAVLQAKLGQKQSGEDIGACIKKARSEAKRAFGPASQAVIKNNEAIRLLKDYYAAWLTSLTVIIPNAGESDRDYNHRQNEAQATCDAIWSRFEVEAGL